MNRLVVLLWLSRLSLWCRPAVIIFVVTSRSPVPSANAVYTGVLPGCCIRNLGYVLDRTLVLFRYFLGLKTDQMLPESVQVGSTLSATQ